jgi:hypothetical protein
MNKQLAATFQLAGLTFSTCLSRELQLTYMAD